MILRVLLSISVLLVTAMIGVNATAQQDRLTFTSDDGVMSFDYPDQWGVSYINEVSRESYFVTLVTPDMAFSLGGEQIGFEIVNTETTEAYDFPVTTDTLEDYMDVVIDTYNLGLTDMKRTTLAGNEAVVASSDL